MLRQTRCTVKWENGAVAATRGSPEHDGGLQDAMGRVGDDGACVERNDCRDCPREAERVVGCLE